MQVAVKYDVAQGGGMHHGGTTMDKAAESAAQTAGLIVLAHRLQAERAEIDKYASNAADEWHVLFELSITELHEGARAHHVGGAGFKRY